jgi:LytS/YehU family sensor histidine kinase
MVKLIRSANAAAVAIGAVLLLSTLEATQLIARASLEGWRVTVPSVVVRIVASWIVLAVLSLAAWRVAQRVPVTPWSARAFWIHGTAMVTFAALHVTGTAMALVAVDHRHDLQRTMKYFGVAYVALDVLLYALIVGIASTWQFKREAAQRTLAAAKLAEALQRAQLDAVRRQLDPHFLFNTLNSISALALRGDGVATADAIAVLSGLLRETLRPDAPAVHALTRELEYIERYMSIVQMRFPGAVRLQVQADEPSRSAAIPCLALQPLVENAVVHGFRGGTRAGLITVAAALHDRELVVSVTDDGDGTPAAGPLRDGIGLSSLRARVRHIFGEAGALHIARGFNDRGTRATLRIPAQAALA